MSRSYEPVARRWTSLRTIKGRIGYVEHLAPATRASGHDPRHGLPDLLGHSMVEFTLQTYVHSDEAAAIVAIDQVERLIGGGGIL